MAQLMSKFCVCFAKVRPSEALGSLLFPYQLWWVGDGRSWEFVCDCTRGKINEQNSLIPYKKRVDASYAKGKKENLQSNVKNKRASKFLKYLFSPTTSYLTHPFTHSCCCCCRRKTNYQRGQSPSPSSSMQSSRVITLAWRNRQFSCSQEGKENSIRFHSTTIS